MTTYKPSTTDAVRIVEIQRHFRRRESARWLKIVLLFMVGAPALLVGPLVISGLYWAISMAWSVYVPWSWVFLASLLVVVPSLFWTEWRTGGKYYEQAVLSGAGGDGASPFMVMGELGAMISVARNPRGVMELFLWGPRQILEAVRTVGTLRRVAPASRMRSADMLAQLLTCEHAELARLVPKGDAHAVIAMAYLVQYEWVGISKDISKVWIATLWRKALLSRPS